MFKKTGLFLVLGGSLLSSAAFATTNSQMHIRGSFNGWDAQPMSEQFGEIFQATVNFPAAGSR